MKNNNLILYAAILIFGLVAPFIFPAFKVQLSILCILIVLSITWNIQGGEMGYNSFGNILFYGLGMYLCVFYDMYIVRYVCICLRAYLFI